MRDERGEPKTVEVEAWHKPLSNGAEARPKVAPCVMDYGYRLHSTRDWADYV